MVTSPRHFFGISSALRSLLSRRGVTTKKKDLCAGVQAREEPELMFDFRQYNELLHQDVTVTQKKVYQPRNDISQASLLVWGEHCIECAAPDCFKTCDLYEQRQDQRCRRFRYGIYKNPMFNSFRGYGAEVCFKKWAKLESRGNTRMESLGAILRKEHFLAIMSPAIDWVGRQIFRLTKDIRWQYLAYTLTDRFIRHCHASCVKTQVPDAFLLEVYNPATNPVRMQLSLSLAKEERGTQSVLPYLKTVEFAPGYSQHQVDFEVLRMFSAHSFDVALTPDADTFPALVFLTADFVVFKGERAVVPGKNIKCVVWDLDNTIWDGILAEGDEVKVRSEFVAVIQSLDRRGVLMSVVSKNDYARAWHVLEECHLAEYFLYPKINWLPKSENIKYIARDLNIGLDTFAFVDDSVFELEEVASVLPDVTCVKTSEAGKMLDNPRFQGSDSEEARSRRSYYMADMSRQQDKTNYGENYITFLESCKIVVEIRPYETADFERVSELVQRTNQLNFSGRNYQRDEMAQILKDSCTNKFTLKCSDKYGSYGTIGFAIISFQQGVISVEDFMLSCRVQGKFIEKAFFNYLLTSQNVTTPCSLWVNYKESSRNKPAAQVLEALGFARHETDAGLWLKPSAIPLTCDFMRVESK